MSPSLLRRHPFLSTAFAVAAALALWLLVEVASALFGWHGRGPEPLAPWMTVGYVGRVEGLNPREIDATAGFPTPEVAGHPLTLQEIADRRGVPIEEVYRELDAALRELHGHGQDGRHGERGEDGVGAEAGGDGAGASEGEGEAAPTSPSDTRGTTPDGTASGAGDAP